MDSLNGQLKQMEDGISKGNTRTSSTTEPRAAAVPCPICKGQGLVTHNVPVDHPDFGKAFPCVCQRDRLATRRSAQLRAMSNLDAVAEKTFDTFIVDLDYLNEDQRIALRVSYERALHYAEHPEGWLLFQGNYGSGKTHLACAIANYQLLSGNPVLFVTAPDLLDHLRSTYGPSSEVDYDDLFERVRNTPLLILDDLGAESATPWAQEKLFQLINHRYVHQFNTVITTNVELNRLDQRVRSRLVDRQISKSINMPLPDFRRSDNAGEQSELTNLSLYGDMVFETWDARHAALPEQERRNLQQALQTARQYADAPRDWLLFLGEHGTGKTHLAAAIANYRHRLGEPVIMVTAPDLLDYLRETFNPNTGVAFSKRFHEIRTASLLVIDNLDLTNASTWAREKIHQVADYRYLSRLPTVFTTAQPFEDIDPFLRSRLLDRRRCKVFAILVPDYMGGAVPNRRQWLRD